MSLRIGDLAPDFEVETTEGRMRFEHKYIAGTSNVAEGALLSRGWRDAGFEIDEAVLPMAQIQDGQVRGTFPGLFTFTSTGDRYGWSEGTKGSRHLTLFIENGRVRDGPGGARMLTGLRRIAEVHQGDFRLTANQNVIIANVAKDRRQEIEALVAEHGLTATSSALRRNAMACVALPTCGLALSESERYLPDLVTVLEQRLAAHGLADDEIIIRMTGCPNGCARPYLAEIGLVGKGPGRYNLYLGAAVDGSRLSKLYEQDLDHDGIVMRLDRVFAAYAAERQDGERFGDFVIRAGFVAATSNGRDFHANTGPRRSA